MLCVLLDVLITYSALLITHLLVNKNCLLAVTEEYADCISEEK